MVPPSQAQHPARDAGIKQSSNALCHCMALGKWRLAQAFSGGEGVPMTLTHSSRQVLGVELCRTYRMGTCL